MRLAPARARQSGNRGGTEGRQARHLSLCQRRSIGLHGRAAAMCAHLRGQRRAYFAKCAMRGEIYRHDRIRVAYVSADFHAHATSALMAGVWEHHDRTRFETVAISFGKNDESEMRARVMRAFDRFIDVRERS